MPTPAREPAAPIPTPPIGPAADPHSDANALARLREIRRVQSTETAQPSAESEAPAAGVRGADGKFVKRAEAPAQSEEAPQGEVEGGDVEAAEQQAGGDEPAEVATLSDLAKHLGIEPSELYDLRIPVEVDGSTEEITLGQYKDSYRASQRIEREQAAVQKAKTDFESWQTQQKTSLERAEAEAGAVVQAMRNQFLADYQAVDWNTLRYSDPAEFAAKHTEFEQRRMAFEGVIAQARAGLEQRHATLAQETQAKIAERGRREYDALLSKVPEWKDEKASEPERAKVFEYLQSSGYGDNDLRVTGDDSLMLDHRFLVMARKAMKYDEGNKAVKTAMKKIVIGKKVLAPGARSASPSQTQTENRLRATLKKSGSPEDALSLLKHLRSK